MASVLDSSGSGQGLSLLFIRSGMTRTFIQEKRSQEFAIDDATSSSSIEAMRFFITIMTKVFLYVPRELLFSLFCLWSLGGVCFPRTRIMERLTTQAGNGGEFSWPR
ncbi:MAG TPA: hypothetical protein VJY33_04980 [Isosphaeraceae bacterium]|nr:hypothetical protein [Isosphaeraceae bacterium]